MNLVELLNQLLASVAEFKAKAEQLEVQLADTQAQIDLAKQEAYERGFEAGKASVTPPASDKIYSQAEVEQMIADAVAPLHAEVAALKAEIDVKVTAALAAFKAEILAKYEEMQVIETQAETGFAELLK